MYCIALYCIPRVVVDYQDLRKIRRDCLYFSEVLKKGYISKIALSESLDEKQPLSSRFVAGVTERGLAA